MKSGRERKKNRKFRNMSFSEVMEIVARKVHEWEYPELAASLAAPQGTRVEAPK